MPAEICLIDETPRVMVLLAQIEHTAQLARSDGSEVTQRKLEAHITQFYEACAQEVKRGNSRP